MGKKIKVKGKYSPLGLDIGSQYIKAFQLCHSRGRILLSNYMITRTPESVVQNGIITDPKAIVKQLPIRMFRNRKVNIAITGHDLIMRQIELPLMSVKELSEAIRWEAEKHILIPVEEAVVDYINLGERVTREGMVQQILLVVAAREVINSYMDTVKELGLYPLAIEVQPLSLIRLLAVSRLFSESTSESEPHAKKEKATTSREKKNALVLEIGWEKTTLVVVEDGRYSFSRILGIGCLEFCEQVERSTGVERQKSLKLLHGDSAFMQPGVQDAADILLKEVQRSLDYYFSQMQNRGKKIANFYLLGGGGKINGIEAFLGKGLQMKPLALNPFSFIDSHPHFALSDLERDASFLCVAAGLALRGWLR